MENILKVLAESIENEYLLVIGSVLITFILSFKKSIPIWVERLTNIKNRLNRSALLSHDLFNTCARVKKEVSLMKFYTHGEYDVTKSKMCRDFTNYKIDVCVQGFKDVLGLKIEKMTPDAFKKHIFDLQIDLHNTYIDKIKIDWMKKGIKEDDVNHVINLFEDFRYDVIQAFEHRINSIFGSTTHENNNRRLLAIFEMWAFGIDMLPRDMQTTFETLNGRFKEIKY